MRGELRLKIWGTRGSFPAPAPDRLEYGGNTLCVSAELSDRLLVLDAGSGLSVLGSTLEAAGWSGRIDLFIGHLHLDHIIGLFNFPPFFNPRAEIHLYGAAADGRTFGEQLRALVGPPLWPVGFSDFKARIFWHGVQAGERRRLADGLEYDCLSANHPGGGVLYRFEVGEKSFFYGLDCEMDESVWEALLSFSGNCDLLICDGQYDERELEGKKGWGHSSWRQAVRLRREAKAGKVLLIHYAWDCTDERLRAREREARENDGHCIFAREGMEVTV